jgi:4a-hydroxytetrahydrobiopterin dehydratase
MREAEELSRKVPEWTLREREIARQFEFKGFPQSIDFVNRIAGLAEKRNHHPDISISYDKVTLTLSSHDAGGLTSRDFDLAYEVDRLI